VDLGKYVLDSLQIYFPWDDDLYTFLKERGLMSKNPKLKVLPLIYSDNCVSTQGVERIKRNYVIDPTLYGLSEFQLGWERIGEKEFIIPAERPQLHVISENGAIKFKVEPKINGKDEYHIEYSVTSKFGKLYSNWVAFYLPIKSAKEFIDKIVSHFHDIYREVREVPWLNVEAQQKQREEMHWTSVKVLSYRFSISSFEYAVKYLQASGVTGEMPALVFDSNNPQHLRVMEPYIKLGIVETKEETGFWTRNVQLVMKLAQDKITIGKRGKKVKVKGFVEEGGPKESYVKVPAQDFLSGIAKLRAWFGAQGFEVKL